MKAKNFGFREVDGRLIGTFLTEAGAIRAAKQYRKNFGSPSDTFEIRFYDPSNNWNGKTISVIKGGK